MTDRTAQHDVIFQHLSYICDALSDSQIPYAIADGTLLGAVREGDILATEERDFDIDLLSEYAPQVLEMNETIARDGYEIVDRVPGAFDFDISYLFDDMKQDRVPVGGAGLIVLYGGEFVGDIYLYSIFSDGLARRHCFDTEASVNAKMTLPAWYFEEHEPVTIRGKELSGPREPRAILRKTYGEDWETPISPGDFETGRHPDSGAVYDSDIERLILLALQSGWNGDYSDRPAWPRDLAHVGSYAGRRWLFRHEPFLFLRNKALFTEAERELIVDRLSEPSPHVRETVLALIARRLHQLQTTTTSDHATAVKSLQAEIAEHKQASTDLKAAMDTANEEAKEREQIQQQASAKAITEAKEREQIQQQASAKAIAAAEAEALRSQAALRKTMDRRVVRLTTGFADRLSPLLRALRIARRTDRES